MSYIVQRKTSFYVVDYTGHDPITGKERRRWHPAGNQRRDAEEMKARLDHQRPEDKTGGTLAEFMSGTWLKSKPSITHPTRCRYKWMVEKNINPRIGHVKLGRLRASDLDALYADLLNHGGKSGQGLATKTVLEVHRTISNALDLAVDRQLIDINPAHKARPPSNPRRSEVAAIWDAEQLAHFLCHTQHKRLYPSLHLTAFTGIRRGELAGLNWADLNIESCTLSITRTRQMAGGQVVQAPVKTRTSRRCIDLDTETVEILQQWRRRLVKEGAQVTRSTPMFLNKDHQAPSPESFSQLFTRSTTTAGLPRIRFHDLRHTHASLLVAAGVLIKVVSERLGHSHPGFTMHTYQHLLPGMGAAAAQTFANLIGEAGR